MQKPACIRPGRNLFASTDMHLLRKCPCPVWIDREPASQVLAQAETLDSDLIVLATLSRPHDPGLSIGTTAEDFLQAARTSVLAHKPEGFVTPVQ